MYVNCVLFIDVSLLAHLKGWSRQNRSRTLCSQSLHIFVIEIGTNPTNDPLFSFPFLLLIARLPNGALSFFLTSFLQLLKKDESSVEPEMNVADHSPQFHSSVTEKFEL